MTDWFRRQGNDWRSEWRGQHSNGCNCEQCMYQQPKETNMSASAWCNINDPETNAPQQMGHAFNAEDPDREHYTKTRTVDVPTGNSFGRPTFQERQEVTENLDMCGYHSRKQAGLFQDPPQIVTAETIEEVEAESDRAAADMWKARYEASEARRNAGI
jgi:hypothetical protein